MGEYRVFKGRNLNGLKGVNTGIGNFHLMNKGIWNGPGGL
jgi:hypothetical protein